jgi:hypothetical protein
MPEHMVSQGHALFEDIAFSLAAAMYLFLLDKLIDLTFR